MDHRNDDIDAGEGELGDFVDQLVDYYELTERTYRAAVAAGTVPYGLASSTNFEPLVA
jgi:hypothetical protein